MKPELQYVASLPAGRPFRVRIEYHPDALLDCLDRAAARVRAPISAELLVKWRERIEASLTENDETTFVLKVALADMLMLGFKVLDEPGDGKLTEDMICTVMREFANLCVGVQMEVDRRTGRNG